MNLRDVAPTRWKNGNGTTRELLRLDGSFDDEAFALRVSVAEVNCDAEFSCYPGVHRILALLRGAGMRVIDLDYGDTHHTLDKTSSLFEFEGEHRLEGRLLDGPMLDFNVMVCRAAGSARLHIVEEAEHAISPDCQLIFVAAGHVETTFADGSTARLHEWDYLNPKKSPATRLTAGPASTAFLVEFISHHRKI